MCIHDFSDMETLRYPLLQTLDRILRPANKGKFQYCESQEWQAEIGNKG